MTSGEKRILGAQLKRIIRQNKESWWLLKRQIWDLGYQSYYEAQGDFLTPIEEMVFNLQPEVKNALLIEWRNADPHRSAPTSYSNFHSVYTLLIMEEVIDRARIAAMRTWNWDRYL